MSPYLRKLEIQQLNNGGQVATLLPLARAWHEGSRYAHLPFAEDKFFRMVASIEAKQDSLENIKLLAKIPAVGW